MSLVLVVGALGMLARHMARRAVPFTNRKRFIFFPRWAELMLSNGAERKHLRQRRSEANFLLTKWRHPHDAIFLLRRSSCLVNRVGRRLVRAVDDAMDTTIAVLNGNGLDHLRGVNWRFVVLRHDKPNAMALPNGTVFVHTALVELLDFDEDRVAAIIGHEMAHCAARHAAERMTFGVVAQVCADCAPILINRISNLFAPNIQSQRDPMRAPGRVLLGEVWRQVPRASSLPGNRRCPSSAATRRSDPDCEQPAGWHCVSQQAIRRELRLTARELLVHIGQNLPRWWIFEYPRYRQQEHEADLIGMKLAARAGYNPKAALDAYTLIGNHIGAPIWVSYGSTHPAAEHRVSKVAAELKAMECNPRDANNRLIVS